MQGKAALDYHRSGREREEEQEAEEDLAALIHAWRSDINPAA